jgi:uncharacterized membrane protein YjdF
VTPDWTGSPQHVAAGLLLAVVVFAVLRGRVGRLAAASLGVVVTMAAEALVELVEYPLLYGDGATAAAYYDTIADIGATLVGAVLGAVIALVACAVRRR